MLLTICSTEWPILCWCAVEKLISLTYCDAYSDMLFIGRNSFLSLMSGWNILLSSVSVVEDQVDRNKNSISLKEKSQNRNQLANGNGVNEYGPISAWCKI